MNCKFCNAEVGEEHKFCPFCGKNLTEEENPVCDEEIVPEIPAEKPKKKVWKLVLAIVGAVVALGVLAVVLLYALGVEFKLPTNDIFNKDSYTLNDDKAAKKSDEVVAVVGDNELTNGVLQIYYANQVWDFLNYYGSYASYVGLDTTKPLSEQTCGLDETMTWEQYFLDVAIQTWHNYQTLAMLAEEKGFTLSEEMQKSLDELPQKLEEQAKEGKFDSAEAMLKDAFGENCTMDHYLQYMETAYISNEFYNTEYERLTPTDTEVETYFAENEATFKENGITKESGLVSSVRHILIAPEGGTKDDDGNVTYSEDEMAAALAKAEAVLQQWKDGEKTEESFAALVKDNTADEGSATTGGLYENIAPGSNYVKEFLNWAIDMKRQKGDTEIVKTEFGYHIMYFVSGEAYWLNSARTQLLADRTSAMIDEAMEKWSIEVTYKNIALCELEL